MFLIASIIALFRYVYNLMLNIRAITLCKSSLNILLITFVYTVCILILQSGSRNGICYMFFK